jgi:hypothetical protein
VTSRTGTVFLPDEERVMALLRRLGRAIALLFSAVGILCRFAGIIGGRALYGVAVES